ncbi:MAG: endonuclease III [Blastocatellia bacterium]
MEDLKAKTKQIIRLLRRAYPDAHCALNHTTPFELLIATILSAQCTDERVNIVTADLFRKYRRPADYLKVDIAEIEQDIRSTGFYRNKAKSVQGTARLIHETFGDTAPQTIDELLTLPGVARKTANVVLGNCFGKPDGVVVDTHVSRLSQKLALTRQETPEKIERELNQLVPQKEWTMFPHLLISHGRAVCNARKPRCGDCALESLCPSSLLKSEW